jgi:hypothetical protein
MLWLTITKLYAITVPAKKIAPPLFLPAFPASATQFFYFEMLYLYSMAH